MVPSRGTTTMPSRSRDGDNLEDLRATLPMEFRDAPLADVPALWIAVNAARRGQDVSAIANLTHLAPATIRRIIELTQSRS